MNGERVGVDACVGDGVAVGEGGTNGDDATVGDLSGKLVSVRADRCVSDDGEVRGKSEAVEVRTPHTRTIDRNKTKTSRKRFMRYIITVSTWWRRTRQALVK